MINKIIYKLKLIFIPCRENKYRPKFLEGKFLFYYAILLLVLKIIIVPFFLYFPKTIFFADLTKTALVEFTNTTRESLGFQALKENPILNEAAYLKAKDMLEKDYFAHNSPEGITPWYWFQKIGYNYNFAGENLAIGFLDSEEVNQAWLDSPSHRRNLLNPNYNEIGIAVIKGEFQGRETAVVVQLFGAPKVQAQVAKANGQLPQEEVSTETIPAPPKEAPSKEILSTLKENENKGGLTFNFLSFLASDYYNLLQKIIYGSLIFVIISLLVTVFCDIFIYRRFEIQYKDMVFKTIGFSILLILLLFFDKGTVIQLIPHNFSIY